MGRRGQECRCCSCNQCDTAPTRLLVHAEYPAGGGVMIAAGPQQTEAWRDFLNVDISTNCVVAAAAVTIARVRITDPGEGYTSTPFVTANKSDGSTIQLKNVVVESPIVAIDVTNPGAGYTTTPIVTLPVGGSVTNPASAIAIVEGPIVSVTLTSGGAGYEEAPDVLFSTGINAKASASINENGSVTAITLTQGGEGYTPNVLVTIPGGTTPAKAIATIRGTVVAVLITNPGNYVIATSVSFPSPQTFPSLVTIEGSATAVARYAGKLTGLDGAGSGFGYTTAPSISISGGGGQNATATAELNWEQQHTRSVQIVDCEAKITMGQRFNLNPLSMPAGEPSSISGYQFIGEGFEWSVLCTTHARRDALDRTGAIRLLQDAWFFENEAIVVSMAQQALILPEVTARTITTFTRPFFSRVVPSSIYKIVDPPQPDTAINVSIAVEWQEYVDAKNDSFWYLESIALVNGGDNLFVLQGPSQQVPLITIGADNTRHVLSNRLATFVFSAPEAAPVVFSEFSVQPSVNVTFEQGVAYFAADAASIVTGGQTALPDGAQVTADVLLTRGYLIAAARVKGTVQNGQLDAVEVLQGGAIQGPATMTAINTTLIADLFFREFERVATGESGFVTTRTHTEPVVTATSQPNPFAVDSSPATVSVVLEPGTDENGDDYWTVAQVNVTSPGSGYGNVGLVPPIIFEAEPPGVVAQAPIMTLQSQNVAPFGLLGVTVQSGGKFFVRNIVETEELLPSVACIGPVSTATGWQSNQIVWVGSTERFLPDIGEQWTSFHLPRGFIFRTRRCPLPIISAELE